MPRKRKTMIKPMSDRYVCLRILVDTIAFILAAVPLLYIYAVKGGDYEPVYRGFYCDDENIKHPYVKDETISVGVCALLWIIAVSVAVFTIEILTNLVYDFPEWSQILKKKNAVHTAKIPRVVIELWR